MKQVGPRQASELQGKTNNQCERYLINLSRAVVLEMKCDMCDVEVTQGKFVEVNGIKYCYNCVDKMPRDM